MNKAVRKEHPNTVNMLLNPKMFNGRNEGRIAPLFLSLTFIFLPLLIFGKLLFSLIIYFGLNVVWIILFVYLFYCWRVIAKLLLREKERVERFKTEQLHKYISVSEVSSIKYIHDDGCVEYINGDISYYLICKNGNKPDPLLRAQDLDKFFSLAANYKINIYVLNIINSESLSKKYENIATFKNKGIAQNMLDIVDYNKKYVEDNTLLMWTVYEISGSYHDKVKIKNIIKNGLNILHQKIYKEAVLADKKSVSFILNRTLTTDVDFEEIFVSKFGKGDYYTSKVLGYDIDLVENKKDKQGEGLEWIPKL